MVRKGNLWLPARVVDHSLPAERDVFVGRREPLDDLARRFERGARLVSVLGMGGTGKTRLAVRFGWSWLGDFPGGVWFCDLSPARSVDGVFHAVAQALEVPLGKEDPAVQLGRAIAGRGACLIILDNFEQVSRHAEATVGRWMDAAGDASFLATSREVLGISGEEILALAPLPAIDAAALFISRAELAKDGFQRSADDDEAIAGLMTLLDGLPLAIELAAARVRVMPTRTIVLRMTERFSLLASAGGRLDRQATLRTTFDWSWELLSLYEKAALAQLSVFEGGFTLAAAESVLDLSPYGTVPWPVDVLQSLVDKSLVRYAGDRFDLLRSIQDYAAEHLRTPGRYLGSGPSGQASAQAAHGAHFAAFAEADAVGNAGIELDNLVVACRRAVVREDSAVAVASLEGAWAALRLRGPFRVGTELADLVRSMQRLETNSVGRLERVSGRALLAVGRVAEARGSFEISLDSARRVRDRPGEGRALCALGSLHADEGRVDEAQAHQTAALAVARELTDRSLEYEVLNCLGTLYEHQGRLEEALSHYDDGLRLARELGNRRWEGGILGNLGLLHANRGDLDAAATHLEAALGVAREVGDRQWEGNALSNLGLLHYMRGQLTEAMPPLEAALTLARQLGHTRLECIGSGNLGMVYDELGRRSEARSHYEAALKSARALQDPRSEGQFLNYLGLLHARESQFDDARRCLDAGHLLLSRVFDSLNLGILLFSRAEMEYLSGDQAAARHAFDVAEHHAASVAAGPDSELGRSMTRVRALLESGAKLSEAAPPSV